MKKFVSCMIALLVILTCMASCKTAEDDPSQTESDAGTSDPLEFWNTYIMQDASVPFTYFSCRWDLPIHSSQTAPCSSDPKVIAEVLRRLRTLSVTEAQKIDPEAVSGIKEKGISNLLMMDGSLMLDWIGSENTNHPKSSLEILLEGDVLILYFDETNYACYRLDSDKTEFRSSMIQYAKEHNQLP